MHLISNLVAARFAQLYNQLFNPDVSSFDDLFNFRQNPTAKNDSRAILHEKLAQLLTVTGELSKSDPRFPMILLAEKIEIRYVLAKYDKTIISSNTSQALATVLFTSILPVMNPIIADNFIETLCSWNQATFFLESREDLISNDHYNRKFTGLILFGSFKTLLNQFTADTDERPLQILESYVVLLQSIYKNIEYRTKEETDWLSGELNALFEAFFVCWSKLIVITQHEDNKISLQVHKKFSKLMKLLYAIVQDSTLLALQRCFFEEDYSQLLGQFDEQIEMIFKQSFSSNLNFL